ncbi:MAG: hypothetical protein ACPGES_08855, partial [Coraliomargarita sp.]
MKFYHIPLAFLIGLFTGWLLFDGHDTGYSIQTYANSSAPANEPAPLPVDSTQPQAALVAPHPDGEQLDLVQQFEALDTIDNPELQSDTLIKILVGLRDSESSRSRALELLLSRDYVEAHTYWSFFSDWAAEDADAARLHLEQFTGPNLFTAIHGFICGLAGQDPLAAASFAETLVDTSERTLAISTVVSVMIENDLESALSYMSGLQDLEVRNQVMVSAINELAKKDPQRAFKYVQTQMSGRLQDNAMGILISGLAKQNPEEAIAMMNQLPYGRAYQ